MSKNCLLSELKLSTGNTNLDILGMIRVKFADTRGNMAVKSTVAGKILLENATVNGSNEINMVAGNTYNTNSKVITDVSLGYYTVYFPKYYISSLSLSGVGVDGNRIDARELAFLTDGTGLIFDRFTIDGDMGNVDMSKIVDFYSDRSKYNGEFDVTQVGANGRLTRFFMAGSTGNIRGSLNNLGSSYAVLDKQNFTMPNNKNVSLSIEGFVTKARQAGSTTGEITIVYANAISTTFNGSVVTTVDTPISWTATTITCNGVTIDA